VELGRLALVSGNHGKLFEGQLNYHLDAEAGMDQQWATLIWPLIKDSDFSVVVDLAAGYGRNSAKLLPQAGQLIVVDINQACIDFCRQRFQGQSKVRFIKNDGASLKEISDTSVTLVYSFDAMVHFESDVVRSYLREFQRILKPGGTCFCHHSNSMEQPGGGLIPPHSRNFMCKELFAHYSLKAGLKIVQQTIIDWGDFKNLDCLTKLQKPH
jgi:ubiquinone/menaquinone biosynthesis C-methylase UbiE